MHSLWLLTLGLTSVEAAAETDGDEPATLDSSPRVVIILRPALLSVVCLPRGLGANEEIT